MKQSKRDGFTPQGTQAKFAEIYDETEAPAFVPKSNRPHYLHFGRARSAIKAAAKKRFKTGRWS